MPSILRKSKVVWVVSIRENDKDKIEFVSTTFRSAYKIAMFEAKIANPCVKERTARILYRRTGLCLLWDADRFESLEEAMYSPVGQLVRITEVPIKKI